MEHLRFKTYEDLNRFLTKLTCIGKGTQGKCYLYKNRWTLKIFHSNINAREFLQFADVGIESFSFVKYYIYVGDRVVGVIAPFIKGQNIKEHELALEKITTVARASSTLESDVEQISYLSIQAWDVLAENVIYSNGKLGIIDTIKFYYVKKDNNVLPANINEVMLPIIDSSLGITYASTLDPLKIRCFLEETHSRYKDYYKDTFLLQSPRELLLGIKDELEEYLGHKIERFSDAEEPLKRKLIK